MPRDGLKIAEDLQDVINRIWLKPGLQAIAQDLEAIQFKLKIIQNHINFQNGVCENTLMLGVKK